MRADRGGPGKAMLGTVRVGLIATTMLAVATSIAAAPVPTAPATIRITGSPADGAMIARLEKGYGAAHPEVHFQARLAGPESAMAGTYTGTADIAFLERELRQPMERMAYEWAMLHPPLRIVIATGGIKAGRQSDQIGIFVNAANPLASLTMADLDALFGEEHKLAPQIARRWREVGGASDEAVQVYGPDLDDPAALFFRHAVMKDSRKWNAGYRAMPGGAASVAAVAADRNGIAFAPVSAARPGARLVAIAGADGVAHLPSADAIAKGVYPLTRSVEIVVAHDKGEAPPEAVRDFVSYVLSPAGQSAIARDGSYFALQPAEAARERAKLEKAS